MTGCTALHTKLGPLDPIFTSNKNFLSDPLAIHKTAIFKIQAWGQVLLASSQTCLPPNTS